MPVVPRRQVPVWHILSRCVTFFKKVRKLKLSASRVMAGAHAKSVGPWHFLVCDLFRAEARGGGKQPVITRARVTYSDKMLSQPGHGGARL